MHLGEGAVDPGGPAVLPLHGRGLGTDEHPVAVLGQERELVHLTAGRLHGAEQSRLYVGRVGATGRPARKTAAADRIVRRPAEDPYGFGIPMGDDTLAVEGAQARLHTVEQSGE
ncbi:hypothetical protein M2266_003071 [Streptomyces sp. SPB162]|nr:hypothetical protein [Streptomyces sp. SPB162]